MTARSDVGRRLDDLYPQHRVADHARGARPRAPCRRRGGGRRLSARRRRAARRGAARAGRQGRRPERRLPAEGPRRSTRSGTASTRPRSSSTAPSTAFPELYRDADQRPPSSSPTPAATRPPRSLRWPHSPGRPDRRRRDRRQVGCVGRGTGRDRQDPLRRGRRERQRVRRPAPPAHAGDRAGARQRSAPTLRSRSRRTCCRSTRASSSPATSRPPSGADR